MAITIHLCDVSGLRDIVQAHRYLFHELGLPVISDAEFVALLCEAQRIIAPNAVALDWSAVEYTEQQILLALHFLMDF